MTRTRAFIFVLAVVLPGIPLRTAPHLGRVTQVVIIDPNESPAVTAENEPSKELSTAIRQIPPRLSQRPASLLVAGFAAEVLLIASMLYVVIRSPSIIAVFAALAVRYQVIAAGLLTFLVTGLLGGSDQTFPFVPWRMYSGPPPKSPQIYEFVGVSRSGRTSRLDLGQVLPVLEPLRFHNILATQCSSLQQETQAAQREILWTQHKATLQAAGRLYNRSHPEDPILQVSVSSVIVSLDNAQVRVDRHRLWSVEVD
jgi:hypothetical protein